MTVTGGTNFERLAFKRMIQDIEVDCVNMVLTKDLSRLGYYVQTGQYTDFFLPRAWRVLNDSYDSDKEDNDNVLFRNIMN